MIETDRRVEPHIAQQMTLHPQDNILITVSRKDGLYNIGVLLCHPQGGSYTMDLKFPTCVGCPVLEQMLLRKVDRDDLDYIALVDVYSTDIIKGIGAGKERRKLIKKYAGDVFQKN